MEFEGDGVGQVRQLSFRLAFYTRFELVPGTSLSEWGRLLFLRCQIWVGEALTVFLN